MNNNDDPIPNSEDESSTGSEENITNNSENAPLYTMEEVLSTCKGIWKKGKEEEIIALDLKCDWLLEQEEINQDLNLKAQIIAVKNKNQSLIADFNERDPSKKIFSVYRQLPKYVIILIAMCFGIYYIFKFISAFNSATQPYIPADKPTVEAVEPASNPKPKSKIQTITAYLDPTHLSEEIIKGIARQANIKVADTPSSATHVSLGYDPADLLTDPKASSKVSMKNPNYLMVMVNGKAKCKTSIPLIEDFPDITMERSMILETINENIKTITTESDHTTKIVKAICSCLKKD